MRNEKWVYLQVGASCTWSGKDSRGCTCSGVHPISFSLNSKRPTSIVQLWHTWWKPFRGWNVIQQDYNYKIQINNWFVTKPSEITGTHKHSPGYLWSNKGDLCLVHLQRVSTDFLFCCHHCDRCLIERAGNPHWPTQDWEGGVISRGDQDNKAHIQHIA